MAAVEIDYLADHEEYLTAFVEWHHTEWGHLRPGDTIAARTERVRPCCGRRQVPTVFVAFSGAEFIGSAMLIANDMNTRLQWSPWIAGVFVIPRHRRKGIGAQLIRRALDEACAIGVGRVYLYTFNSEEFYARRGWSPLERTRYFGRPVVVMSKEVGPNKSRLESRMAVLPNGPGLNPSRHKYADVGRVSCTRRNAITVSARQAPYNTTSNA